jgi:two-component system nitrogen regulation sensor histidine kinase NtrY
MVSRTFRTLSLFRIVVLGATIGLFCYLLLNTSLYLTTAVVLVVIVYQVYSLMRFVESSNRRLIRFLNAIRHSDFSQSFATGLRGKDFDELNRAFTQVISRFRDVGLEREEYGRYLQTVVDHVGIGLLAFSEDGEVELINPAAKRLLGLSHLRNIQGLKQCMPRFLEAIHTSRAGGRDLVKTMHDDAIVQLAVDRTELVLRKKKLALVSFQNIGNELDRREMEAWQNLIRVLTHEIKNSLTPIASLSTTLQDALVSQPGESVTVPPARLDDMNEALATIGKRSQGLLRFVEAYRDLTHIPKPQFEVIGVQALFDRLETLVAPHLSGKRISVSFSLEPESLQVTGDPRLLEQVLLNLILNAIQALDGHMEPRIAISAMLDERGRTLIRVTDNGPGIVKDALERIFIPFFSTKKEGSGIGLSLSRQIMRLHRGDLTVRSGPHQETTFTMRF